MLLSDSNSFGALLEQDIQEAIEQTTLKPYTLHNVPLQTETTWRQIDHLLLLPHKIVFIEAKNTSADRYRITPTKDFLHYSNHEGDYGKSIVKQTTKTKTILDGIINTPRPIEQPTTDSFDLFYITSRRTPIIPIGCIRVDLLINEQMVLPIYKDTDLTYYLKSLELEISHYSEDYLEKYFAYYNSYEHPKSKMQCSFITKKTDKALSVFHTIK